MFSRMAFVGMMIAMLVAGCAMDPNDELGTADRTVKGASGVEIMDVGYGGTTIISGRKVILPEFVILFNYGRSTENIGGWYLTDGGNWGGDGVVRFPQGTTIAAGDMLVVANYPPPTHLELYYGYEPITFEEAYGYSPDFEIAGNNPDVPNLTTVGGRIRLKHGECSYDGDCWDVQELVWLIDGAQLSDAEIIGLLENQDLGQDDIVSAFPAGE